MTTKRHDASGHRTLRDTSVVVRMTAHEKARLVAYAQREDLRVGQAARHFINAALAARAEETTREQDAA